MPTVIARRRLTPRLLRLHECGPTQLTGSVRSKAEKLLADLLAGSVEGVVAVVNALTVTQPDVDAAGARSPGRDIIDIPPDSKLHLRRQPAPH